MSHPVLRTIAIVVVSAFMACQVLAKDTPAPPLPSLPFGVTFIEGSTSTVIVERDGKRFLLDLASRSVKELDDTAANSSGSSSSRATQDPAQAAPVQRAAANPAPPEKKNIYHPGDQRLVALPTGLRVRKHDAWVDFSHRFAYTPPFEGRNRGHLLGGLDGFAIASFGFQYGVTDRLSLAIYRAPSLFDRTLELRAAYRLADENEGKPFNATFRFSVDGQNDFQRNFTTNFELVLSKSVTNRAQLYLVPTGSIHNRPATAIITALEDNPPYQPCGQALANDVNPSLNVRPCADTFSLGAGAAVDVRPTVALIAEVIPTLVNGRDIGIHRPAYAFGIEKKIFRHSFTFALTNAVGTTVAQRSGTRAIFLQDPHADTPSGFIIGFNLSRQLH